MILIDCMDEGLLYKTTRVVVRRGLVVAYRSLVTAGRQQVEDKTPIHIADVQTMTEAFSLELRNKSASRDDASSGGESKVARVLIKPTKPESPSGKRATPSAELVSGSKRVRRQRVLTNVSFLGEIYQVT